VPWRVLLLVYCGKGGGTPSGGVEALPGWVGGDG
jgi:hypothetical protein